LPGEIKNGRVLTADPIRRAQTLGLLAYSRAQAQEGHSIVSAQTEHIDRGCELGFGPGFARARSIVALARVDGATPWQEFLEHFCSIGRVRSSVRQCLMTEGGKIGHK